MTALECAVPQGVRLISAGIGRHFGRSNSYADNPVVKRKLKYSRARWQIDAHGFARSNGNRSLRPEEIIDLPYADIFKIFRQHSLSKRFTTSSIT